MVESGNYGPDDKLPTEVELSEQYKVSRPTVTRALNALRNQNLITRKAGAGTFVNQSSEKNVKARRFGLIVPRLGKGEIFEPICAQIAARAEEKNFSLLWSASDLQSANPGQSITAVAKQYISEQVDGVFFEPLELDPTFDSVNQKVIDVLDNAGIPVILIDSDYLDYPFRSKHDLVGIDNFRAGYQVTKYFADRGNHRIDFLGRPHSAHTVDARLKGYRSALADLVGESHKDWIHIDAPENSSLIDDFLNTGVSCIVCGNDETAATLLSQLEKRRISVPDQIRVIGFDDVRYAQLLRVPLTTYHQPAKAIGNAALNLMLWRLENPDAPVETRMIEGYIVQRESCGYSGT